MREDNLVKLKEEDTKISIALLAPFVILTLQYLLLINFNILGSSSATVIQGLSKFFVALAFLYALPIVLRRNLLLFLMVYITSIIIFLFQFLFFPANQAYMYLMFSDLFLISLPILIFSMSIIDLKIFKRILLKFAYVIFIIGLILSIQSISGIVDIGVYSGPLSNYLLIPAIVFLNESFNKLTIKKLSIAIISVILIIILGSRGALLSISFFILVNLLFSTKKLSTKKVIMIIFTIVGISFIVYNFDEILLSIQTFFNSHGLYSRTLTLFLQDGIHLSGRDTIYEILINEINSKPFLGFGIAGDRRILAPEFVYAHNIIIEVIGNFGILIGVLLISLLVFFLIRALLNKDTIKKEMIIVWIGLGLPHLLVSSSYIIEMKFWVLIGLLLNKMAVRNSIRKKGHSVI